MTLLDDDLDTDIERMLTIARNRRALGWGYYETNANASSQRYGTRPRNTKSRAGQPNWRTRWPDKNVKPKRERPPPKPRPGAALRTADMVATTLAFAHAGLDIIESRRTT